MWIDYVKLTNFRQYKEEKIAFGVPQRKRNFTIIQGANGSGKTNLVNAITWCLYGEELHLGKKYSGLPIYNMSALHEVQISGNLKVEVEIQMVEESGSKILFKRTWGFRKTDPLHCSAYGDSRFIMMRLLGKEWVSVDDPSYVLSRLIPKSLERYFFFDGERLDDYFKGATGKDIQDAVFNVSQLGILEKVIQHLSKLRNEYLSRGKGLSPNAEILRQKLESFQTSIDEANREIEKLEKEKGEAEKCEEEYDEKLRTTRVGDIEGLVTQRGQLQEELKTLNKRTDDLESDRLGFLLYFYPLIVLNKPLLKIKGLISEKTEAGDIPPDYKRNFLRKLLERRKCICGTDLSKSKQGEKQIGRLLEECDAISDISEELMIIDANVSTMLEEPQDFRSKQIGFSTTIRDCEKRRESMSKQINEIGAKIDGCNIDQIRLWETKRREWRDIRDEKIGEIGKKRAEVESAQRTAKSTQEELKKELQKQDKHKELLQVLGFYEESLNAANKIKNEIMEDVRKEVEEKTEEEFLDLIWKKETYKGVTIDDDYNVSVKHQSGIEGLGTLSAGERQVLALAFMSALNSVSGFDVPIIIDTPLGRLSKEPKKNIAMNLPDYLTEKQVTLLVTEEEYTPEVREKLTSRIGKEYLITFKESGEGNLAKVVSLGK